MGVMVTCRPDRGRISLAEMGRQALLFVSGAMSYFALRGLMDGSVGRAFTNAETVMRLERFLGIYWEPRLQGLIVDHPRLTNLANTVYIWGHWPVIAVVACWLFTYHPGEYRRVRNAMLFSGAVGLVIFAAFPVAPPRLADPALVDTVSLHSEAYRVLQPPAFTNQYAAMPSLHVGWNLLVGIAVARSAGSRGLRLFGWLMPAVMGAAVVFTANHYLLDVVAGCALALLGLLVARWLTPSLVATESDQSLPVEVRVR